MYISKQHLFKALPNNRKKQKQTRMTLYLQRPYCDKNSIRISESPVDARTKDI